MLCMAPRDNAVRYSSRMRNTCHAAFAADVCLRSSIHRHIANIYSNFVLFKLILSLCSPSRRAASPLPQAYILHVKQHALCWRSSFVADVSTSPFLLLQWRISRLPFPTDVGTCVETILMVRVQLDNAYAAHARALATDEYNILRWALFHGQQNPSNPSCLRWQACLLLLLLLPVPQYLPSIV